MLRYCAGTSEACDGGDDGCALGGEERGIALEPLMDDLPAEEGGGGGG